MGAKNLPVNVRLVGDRPDAFLGELRAGGHDPDWVREAVFRRDPLHVLRATEFERHLAPVLPPNAVTGEAMNR